MSKASVSTDSKSRRDGRAPVATDDEPPVATDAGLEAVTAAAGEQRRALARIYRLSEDVRRRQIAMTESVDERNAAIIEAVDRYRCSQRQAARAAGLSLGRISDVLSNN